MHPTYAFTACDSYSFVGDNSAIHLGGLMSMLSDGAGCPSYALHASYGMAGDVIVLELTIWA